MRPFALLSIRTEPLAADDELAAFGRYLRVPASGLTRIQLGLDPVRPRVDDYSGLVLGGGVFTFSDPEETKTPAQRRTEDDLLTLLDDVVSADFPFLGVCFGVGALGAHQGGEVGTAYPEGVGPVTVELTEAGHEDPLFAGLPARFAAYGGHKESLVTVPDSATVLASSPACPVQAFRVGEHVYATQFHPELDRRGLDVRIDVYAHAGYFEPGDAVSLKQAADRVQVTEPMRLLDAFGARYRRD